MTSSKDGRHDTTVHETVAPAVEKETINRHHVEKAQEVVDQEIHQDHYHTSVQPIKDMKVHETQHHDNVVPTQERVFSHGDRDRDLDVRANEAAKFQSSQTVRETESAEQKATVGSTQKHHHVHETIQPVINREVIEPHVTHTTIPIHEVHQAAAEHHTTSALPAVSMSEFQKAGGVLSGRGERQDAFEGEPRGISSLGQNTTTSASGQTPTSATSATSGTTGRI